MQSINAGFHTLRVLMPHLQGEKLSKVQFFFDSLVVAELVIVCVILITCIFSLLRLRYSSMQRSTFSDLTKSASDSSNRTRPSE